MHINNTLQQPTIITSMLTKQQNSCTILGMQLNDRHKVKSSLQGMHVALWWIRGVLEAQLH